MTEGIIVKGIGGFYYVKTGEEIVECKARGRFRNDGLTPLVGDKVTCIKQKEGYYLLDEIKPRKNSIVRPPISNIDQLFIIITPTKPAPNFRLIDTMTAVATLKDIVCIMVINKSDLTDAEEVEQISSIYRTAGFDTIVTSAKENRGADEIKKRLPGKLSAFCGSSGVGKSSLLNLLLPEAHMEVGGISGKISRGKHTTRHVELFLSDNGGLIADTPGFSSFEMEKANPILKEDLPFAFPEFAPYLGKCRFPGCSHLCEPGCAVQEAIAQGKIHPSRMESYREIYEQIKNIKEWEL